MISLETLMFECFRGKIKYEFSEGINTQERNAWEI